MHGQQPLAICRPLKTIVWLKIMLMVDNRGCEEILKPSMCCRKAYVASNSKMDFLADKVAAVPDSVEEEAGPAKKQR